jgi:glucosylceramidase
MKCSGIRDIPALICLLLLMGIPAGCQTESTFMNAKIFETSAAGNQLTELTEFVDTEQSADIALFPEQEFQTITGFGGSFTEASAYLLNRLSRENRMKIIEAYFGESGARYSLTRTHMNSSDFSLRNYSYASVAGDAELKNFSIDEDRDDIIPMIKDAMAVSEEGFKIIASPWTAPPWMKDNNDWRGGRLLPEYYDTWALFFWKYLEAYRSEGIDIWAFTVENEPLGNDSNWESMHFTPEEMNEFVKNHLGPQLKDAGEEVMIFGYDQNRDAELIEWVDAMYDDEEAAAFYDGTAVHWYGSTFHYFPDELQYAHSKAPDKHLIQTEATVDAEVPRWRDDAWYWSKEATDWGWDWAPEERKHLHPKYVPVYRYARDIIGTLNNWVDGWVDWNMVLDRQGGPNWAENWCVAPVIVDPDADEVYFTPLYYIMSHFSRFIRPGAVRIGHTVTDDELMVTAVKNPDSSIVVVVLNKNDRPIALNISMEGKTLNLAIDRKAVQTIVL